jgi:hypothetical protein
VYQREIDSLMDRLAMLAARVVELEDKVAFLMSHESAKYVPVSAEEKAGNEADVVKMLLKGDTSGALRLYREKHSVPFDEAKKAVEELRNKYAG